MLQFLLVAQLNIVSVEGLGRSVIHRKNHLEETQWFFFSGSILNNLIEIVGVGGDSERGKNKLTSFHRGPPKRVQLFVQVVQVTVTNR